MIGRSVILHLHYKQLYDILGMKGSESKTIDAYVLFLFLWKLCTMIYTVSLIWWIFHLGGELTSCKCTAIVAYIYLITVTSANNPNRPKCELLYDRLSALFTSVTIASLLSEFLYHMHSRALRVHDSTISPILEMVCFSNISLSYDII